MEQVQNFEAWLKENHRQNVFSLIEEGAKEYYAMCKYVSQDYITKKYVAETLEGDFDQFYQQSHVDMILANYCEELDIEIEQMHEFLDENQDEIVNYLRQNIDDIVRAANE